jgi:hypothetical protein
MATKLDENQQFSDQTLIQTLYAYAKRVAQKVNRMSGAEFTATYDPGNLADGAGTTTTVSAPGSQLGDYVQATFSLDTQGILVFGWVSAAGTVSVRFQNESGGAIDLASGTLKVKVSPE